MPHHNPAILEALGWTILNSFWQFGILWMLVQVLKRILPAKAAALRYNLFLVVLLGGVGWNMMSFFLVFSGGGNIWSSWTFTASNSLVNGISAMLRWLQNGLPWLAVAYLAWLMVQLFRFSQHWWRSKDFVQDEWLTVPVDWRVFLEQTAYRLNIVQPVQIWLSARIDSPVIFGWLQPVILLPVSALTQLSVQQIEAVLIHELAHIRRQDYIWNLVITIADILFYFNPFVHRLVAMIREEREHACDDWVLQFPYLPETYAGALLVLEQQRSALRSPLVLAANGNTPSLLLNRVQRMLDLPVSKKKNPGKLWCLSSLVLVALGLSFLKPELQLPGLKERHFVQPVVRVEQVAEYPTVSGRQQRKHAIAKSTEKPGSSTRTQNSGIAQSNAALSPDARSQAIEPGMENWVMTRVNPGPDELIAPTAAQANLELVEEERNYSLAEDDAATVLRFKNQGNYPYVPKASFEAPALDTSYPMAVLQSELANIQAREAVLQTQLALNQLKWEELNSRLKAKIPSAAALREELEQSLASTDWKKVQAETDQAVKQMSKMTSSQQAKMAQQLRKVYWEQQRRIEKLQQKLESEQKRQQQHAARKGTIVYF